MMIAQVAVLLFGLAPTFGAPSVPVLVPHVARQYHAQDELGQYVYGYSGGPSAKHEEKSLNGVTRGGYSYVDGNGLVQSAAYVSDPVNGFRVAATNLPVGPAVPDKTKVAVSVPAVAVPAPTFALTATPAVAVAHAPAVAVAHVPAVGVAPALAGSVAPAVPVQTVDTDNADPSVATSSVETEKETYAGAEVLPEVSAEVPEKTEEPVEPGDSEASEAANETDGQAPVSDLPEVSAARKYHLGQVEEVKARNAAQNVLDAQKFAVLHKAPASVSVAGPVPVLAPAAGPVVSSVVAPASFGTFAHHPPSALVPVRAVAPVAPAVVTKTAVSSPVVTKSVVSGPVVSVVGPAVPFHVASQYHAQDELGQYVYGYSGGPSAKHEEKSLDGTTKGGYSYVDAYGLVQSAAYVSDPHGGFRVLATNLPKQPAPAYIPDSPEVEEAKQKLFKAQAEHVAKLALSQ
ncbi:calphotin-like [Cimex lectularius]|uniref:CPR type cuticle protein n=1 Tax=Cimex lectularius TaxID=79782 RepID=A0A8I6S2J5_CIMLE|nr:calphotin-like [Cimex lectularius]